MGIQNIRPMADEVAGLMAARFGGAKRGQQPDLEGVMRKRGGALPRKLRREAMFLVQADRMAGQPKLARQVDQDRLLRAHKALTAYLRPLGQGARLQGGFIRWASGVVLGLMVLAALVVWIMLQRGLI
ncbi:hypothetical protein [Paracoccus shanxieyensis]|uniref:Uncharacterized protein n=1 Tax=Paracoccus shanxieyensis TaxID=2675752 RepID=A0A6L6IVB4_9RHOB|nr:hypothetical protein [Paracoccus shanxieyensis]MTH64445.1 hypothetical protein [Paracoccus shanxieyensis]MTH87562.1 hypothetical protein [Paracoccus shanxieyensis]